MTTKSLTVEEFLNNEHPVVGFDEFLYEIQTYKTKPTLKWDSEVRTKDYEEKMNKNKIICKELQQIDYNNPLNIIDPVYAQNKYNISLFQKEIKGINSILTDDAVVKIMERRENLEMLRKIVKYYLTYTSYENYDRIMKSLKKLNFYSSSNEVAFEKVKATREKMKVIKAHFLLTSSKIALKNSKYQVLKKHTGFLKDVVLTFYKKVKNLKLKNYTYIKFYKENLSLQNNIIKLNNDYPRVRLIEILIDKLRKKNEKFFQQFNNDIDHLFEEKKTNFYDLYCLYSITNNQDQNNPISCFIENARINFKKKSKKIIIETFYFFSESTKMIKLNEMKKISSIPNLKFTERKFLDAFKKVLIQLKLLAEIYIFYWNNKERTEWAIRLSQEFKNKRLHFYTVLDKHVAKLITTVNFILRQFGSIRSTLIVLNLVCLFEDLIQLNMGVENSKFLSLAMKNLILDQIKYENIKNIKKVGILLSGDIWEKTEIEDNFELFSLEAIKDKTPLCLRNYLTVFNDVRTVVNKKTITSLFTKVFDGDFDVLVHQEKTENFDKNFILSKPIQLKKLALTSSSLTIIRGLNDLVIDMLFFDAVVFEIFFQIFNLFDYFIFSSINMMITDQTLLDYLMQEVNFEEIKKRGKLEYGSEVTSFQEKYRAFRKFYLSTKKKLELLFQKKKNPNEEENSNNYEAFDINSLYLPKISPELVHEDSSDKFVKSNYYQNIMVIETIHSLYKIIKRLTHFKSKIELEFQSGFIQENISNYKQLIQEMRKFIFYKLARELIDLEKIKNEILNYTWDPSESEAETQLFNESPFVTDIIKELRNVYSRLNRMKEVREKTKNMLINEFINYVIDNIMDSFSRIKKCNDTGRSIMLKDLKFLKQEVEDLLSKQWGLKISCSKHFELIFTYVNSWYYGNDDLYKFIFDNKLEYKYWLGISNTSPVFNDLPRRQRKDFTQKVENKYYEIFEEVITSFADE